MHSFDQCASHLLKNKLISQEEHDDILRKYAALKVGNNTASELREEVLREKLAKVVQADTNRKHALSEMGEARRNAIDEHLNSYRDPKGRPNIYEAAMRLLENYGFSGVSSVAGRTKAIVSMAHGEMADALRTFEKNFYTGLRHQKAVAADVVREMLQEATNNPAAKALAEGFSKQFEMLRERFNAAGGDIGKIEGGYIPQSHDPVAVRKRGFEAWRDDIRGRLAPERMRDPLTNEPMTPERLDQVLRPVYEQIVSDGWASRAPTTAPLNKGAVANQRQDHRFLAFKSADDWLWYEQHYGNGDPIKTIFGHINGMARDIAAVEILGPNPSATIEWLKQKQSSEHGKWLVGKDSLFQPEGFTTKGEKDAGAAAAKSIEDLWYWVRGRETVQQGVSDFFGNVRNVLTSDFLGTAAITAATTDPFIDRMARRQLGMSTAALFGSNAKVYVDTLSQYFEHLPILKTVSSVLNVFTGAPREKALRASMLVDEFLHIMGDEARYAGTLAGSEWSRFLADRTVTLSGLQPLTKSRIAIFQVELLEHFADNARMSWVELPRDLRTKMAGYGFDAAQWDKMRAVEPSEGMLRPTDVGLVDRGIAERLVEMVSGETERSVPAGTLRSKSFVMGSRPKGQVVGEVFEGFWQFKSFPLSVATLQMEALAHETAQLGKAAGASYAAQLLILTTIGGALALQLKEIAFGRDTRKMSDPEFWITSMATGGGMGLYGDLLFADVNRNPLSLAGQLAGPTVGLATDIAILTGGNLRELARGKDTHVGHELARDLGRYTPVASSLWYARLAYKRELIDQLDYMLDPRAHRHWREEERKAIRERGQGHWWHPGETSPERLPKMPWTAGR